MSPGAPLNPCPSELRAPAAESKGFSLCATTEGGFVASQHLPRLPYSWTGLFLVSHHLGWHQGRSNYLAQEVGRAGNADAPSL